MDNNNNNKKGICYTIPKALKEYFPTKSDEISFRMMEEKRGNGER